MANERGNQGIGNAHEAEMQLLEPLQEAMQKRQDTLEFITNINRNLVLEMTWKAAVRSNMDLPQDNKNMGNEGSSGDVACKMPNQDNIGEEQIGGEEDSESMLPELTYQTDDDEVPVKRRRLDDEWYGDELQITFMGSDYIMSKHASNNGLEGQLLFESRTRPMSRIGLLMQKRKRMALAWQPTTEYSFNENYLLGKDTDVCGALVEFVRDKFLATESSIGKDVLKHLHVLHINDPQDFSQCKPGSAIGRKLITNAETMRVAANSALKPNRDVTFHPNK
eukprot:GEMP01023816.1.p1 GENE.GEMP01023816.1~~GEMP01023816.1.p1  ORF type:complete len:279 (+),score=32.39 GEMP01023816.1:94-930(+)